MLAGGCSETQALVFSSVVERRGSARRAWHHPPGRGRDGQREGLQDKHLPVPSLLHLLLLSPLK